MARTLIVSAPGGEQTLRLVRPIYTVGRAPECDLQINDGSVSRNHARLLVGTETCSVEDLGSSNGTWVEGRRVEGAHELRSGQRVQFGNIDALYRDDSVAADRSVEPVAGSRSGGNLSLQGFLEGEVSIDDSIKTIRASLTKPEGHRGLNWRLKLVALVAGTILLALVAIGGVLIIQQRDAWLGRAVLELRAFAAENLAGLTQGNTTLLSNVSVAGDLRVHDPVVLDARGVVLWAEPGSREHVGQPWTGWPEARPTTREATVLDAPSGSPPGRERILLPVTSEGRLIGWVAAEWDRIAARSGGSVLGIGIAIAAFLVLLSYLVMEGATAWVTRPVRKLSAEVRGLRRQETLSFEPPAGNPELEELTRSLTLALAAAGAGGPAETAREQDTVAVAEGMPVPLVLIDDGYHVVDVNPEARRLLNLPEGGAVHLGRFLTGSYFGTELLKLLKRTRPGEIDSTVLEIPRGGTTTAVRALVRRPARPAGFAIAVVLLPGEEGRGT